MNFPSIFLRLGRVDSGAFITIGVTHRDQQLTKVSASVALDVLLQISTELYAQL